MSDIVKVRVLCVAMALFALLPLYVVAELYYKMATWRWLPWPPTEDHRVMLLFAACAHAFVLLGLFNAIANIEARITKRASSK